MSTVNQGALELLETRRTVANVSLGEPGPSEAEVRRLIAIAARVPDHGKLTPWRFIVVRGAARAALDAELGPIYRARFPEATAEKTRLEETRFRRVPLTIAVVSTAAEHVKIPMFEQEMSAGAATQNLLLGAHALGYSGQWLTGWLCYQPEARAVLGLKDGERIAGFVAIGTPTVPIVDRPRPAYEDVATEWGA